MTRLVVLMAIAALAFPAAAPAACTPRKNLEAMIDDSTSMQATDPLVMRTAALKLLMAMPGNEKLTLGAIEFGEQADPIFGPGPIGKNRGAFGAALDRRLHADGFGTSYDAAFALAGSHDPGADGRLFLTDGGQNLGAYGNGHRGGPPTHVIELGFLVPEDEARLRQIVAETGGSFRQAEDASQLQPAMDEVSALISCRKRPKRISDRFKKRSSKKHSLTVPKGTRSIQLALSWERPSDRFTIGAFKLAGARKLKLSKRGGKTFAALRLTGLRPGKLRYRVKATRLAGPATLVTQASRK